MIDCTFLNDVVYINPSRNFKIWRGKGIDNTSNHGLIRNNNFGLIIELENEKNNAIAC